MDNLVDMVLESDNIGKKYLSLKSTLKKEVEDFSILEAKMHFGHVHLPSLETDWADHVCRNELPSIIECFDYLSKNYLEETVQEYTNLIINILKNTVSNYTNHGKYGQSYTYEPLTHIHMKTHGLTITCFEYIHEKDINSINSLIKKSKYAPRIVKVVNKHFKNHPLTISPLLSIIYWSNNFDELFDEGRDSLKDEKLLIKYLREIGYHDPSEIISDLELCSGDDPIDSLSRLGKFSWEKIDQNY